MTHRHKVELVKKLGEELGYGHLMHLASALWRESLKSKGFPTEGAFIPTAIFGLTEDYKKMATSDILNYDKLINE